MDRLDTLRLFVRVVERGSFSAVAREAGLGQSAVSKQIAALEARLGAQLLRRTSRTMTLTDAGHVLYESALRLVDEFDAVESLVGHGQSAPSGLIRVTVAPVFGRLYIVPRLPEFFARYPDISVELAGSERAINLIEEGFDLAIRNGELADSSMIVRRIAMTPFATVATPAYLAARGVPTIPADLDNHACLIYAPRQEPQPWHFRDASGPILHHPTSNFRTADAEQTRAAVLADLGLAHAPIWLFSPEVASGAIRIVLAEYAPGPIAISAVHPAGRRLPTKVRVFLDYLVETLSSDPALSGQ
ncbi:MAG TPA: LysR family transcriptional regulator [Caulobacteraceae bacterium]|jgi:LysR family transcriptional regulator for bpeEF and oprC